METIAFITYQKSFLHPLLGEEVVDGRSELLGVLNKRSALLEEVKRDKKMFPKLQDEGLPHGQMRSKSDRVVLQFECTS